MISTDKKPPPKRLKSSSGINRISSLPESLMIHILSFLCITDRIKTGVLSRSWRNLWTCVPDLSIRYGIDGPNDHDEFVNFVDETMTSVFRNGWRVKSFRLSSPYHDDYLPNVSVWTFLVAKSVTHEFELDLSKRSWVFYYLPHYLFKNSSFRELRFLNCDVYPSGPVSWKSLKKLSITRAHFGDDAIEMILAGTPVLEILELIQSRDLNSIHLRNSCVKKLILNFDPYEYSRLDFELSAPKLQSLQISGAIGRIHKLVNLTSLAKASLTNVQWKRCVTMRGDYSSFVRGLLENLMHVETLELGTTAIEGIGMLYPKGLSLKCKSLTIDAPQLLGTKPLAIASLLESCPELEMLIITIMSNHKSSAYSLASPYELREGNRFWNSHKSVFNGLKHLRTIKFVGFLDYRAVAFSFAGFLLEKASILQKLSVNMETKGSAQRVTPEEISLAAQKLSSLPKSSLDAELVWFTEEIDI